MQSHFNAVGHRYLRSSHSLFNHSYNGSTLKEHWSCTLCRCNQRKLWNKGHYNTQDGSINIFMKASNKRIPSRSSAVHWECHLQNKRHWLIAESIAARRRGERTFTCRTRNRKRVDSRLSKMNSRVSSSSLYSGSCVAVWHQWDPKQGLILDGTEDYTNLNKNLAYETKLVKYWKASGNLCKAL